MKILKFIDLSRIALAMLLSLVAVSCEKDKKPETEDITSVEIKNFQDGIYFGNFWKEGYADYYFILSSGEIGQSSEVDLAPMNPGDYILYCDLWAPSRRTIPTRLSRKAHIPPTKDAQTGHSIRN